MKPGPKPRPPAEAAARRRAALKRARQKQLKKEKDERAEMRRVLGKTIRRNCPQALTITHREAIAEGLTIRRKLSAPQLYYMTPDGAIRREDFRSAEQLIRDFAAQTKTNRK
jgi:hypothetical protein